MSELRCARVLAVAAGTWIEPPRVLVAGVRTVSPGLFGVDDRGRLADGLRAHLVAGPGDRLHDIAAPRHLDSVSKGA